MQGVPEKAQLVDFIGKLIWIRSNLPRVSQDPGTGAGQAASHASRSGVYGVWSFQSRHYRFGYLSPAVAWQGGQAAPGDVLRNL